MPTVDAGKAQSYAGFVMITRVPIVKCDVNNQTRIFALYSTKMYFRVKPSAAISHDSYLV